MAEQAQPPQGFRERKAGGLGGDQGQRPEDDPAGVKRIERKRTENCDMSAQRPPASSSSLCTEKCYSG
ncbi:hypothetical protein JCM15831A_01750 [Asaia astilbis]